MRFPIPLPLLLVGLLGCSTSDGGPTSGPLQPSLVLTVQWGSDGQAAVAGHLLASPLVVRATIDGDPIAGVPIAWSTASGQIRVRNSVTDYSGFARADWTLGPTAGEVTATAAVGDAPENLVRFRATAWDRVATEVLAAAATTKPNTTVTLRILVHGVNDAVPRAGIPVRWEAPGNSVTPSASVTDASGIATASWSLSTITGRYVARAYVRGDEAAVLAIPIEVVAGPAVRMELTGRPDTIPSNYRTPSQIAIRVTDAYGNPVPGQHPELAESGGFLTVELLDTLSNGLGVSRSRVTPTGAIGMATLTGRLNGGTPTPLGTIGLTVPHYNVQLYWVGPMPYGYRSLMNGSIAAVDTVPTGATVTWWLTPFDYELHDVTILTDGGFTGGGPLPYANPSIVTATFTVPGTYPYVDTETGASGTVVVVP